jgi:hypothetical protein
MTEAKKEYILDLVWRAMSAAADGQDIPKDAEMLATELEDFLDRLIAASHPES